MKMSFVRILCLFVLAFAASAVIAQDPPPETPAGPGGARPGASTDPQASAMGITKHAKTKNGQLSVHPDKAKTFYEIPKA